MSFQDIVSFEEDDVSFEEDDVSFEEDDVSFEADDVSFEGHDVSFEEHNVSFEEDDVSFEEHDVSFEGHDVSFEGHDVSFEEHNVSFEADDVSFEEHDVSFEERDVSFEGHDVSYEEHNVSFEEDDVSFEEHDVSFEEHDVSVEAHSVFLEEDAVFLQRGAVQQRAQGGEFIGDRLGETAGSSSQIVGGFPSIVGSPFLLPKSRAYISASVSVSDATSVSASDSVSVSDSDSDFAPGRDGSRRCASPFRGCTIEPAGNPCDRAHYSWYGIGIRRGMLRSAFACGAVTLLLVGCSSNDRGAGEPVASSAAAITTTDVLSRADQWVQAKLLYCQSANHQPDYDTSCTSTCNRENNALWDPYRSDCSGFVSWAWGLPAPGRVTSTFAPFDTAVSHTIQATDLQPGDAVNNSEHIMLFVQWVTKGSEAEFYEEPGCSSSTPYAHSFQSSVTLNGSSISVAWNGMTFTSIRYDSIQADAPATGSLDTASCDTITGSASDPDAPTTAVTVDLTFDAATGTANVATISQTTSAQKFSFATPLGLKDNAKHTVYAYAEDVTTKAPTLLASAPKTFTCAPPAIPAGIKRHVPSPAAMTAWKLDALLDVAREPAAAVQAVPVGPDFPAAPTAVISDDGSPDVWVIDALQDGTQVRRHVVNPASLAAWQLVATKWTAAKLDAIEQGIDFPASAFVMQGAGSPEIYVMDTAPGTPVGTTTGDGGTGHGPTNGSSSHGCSASPAGTSGSNAWFLALGLLLLRRRR